MGDVDWCEIFVKGAEDRSARPWRRVSRRAFGVGGRSSRTRRALLALVASATRGQSDGNYVTSPDGVEIYVGTNSTNPKFEPVPPPDTDFVFWPFVIDVDVDDERGAPLVAAILRALWNEGFWAVAACSFEEQLPRSGGYRDGRLILADE